MAVAINPAQNAFHFGSTAPSVVPPAEVWDVESTQPRRGGGGSVRTISATHRKYDRSDREEAIAGSGDVSAFETRRERRDTLLLGAGMTAALLIGSAFGGAFAGAGDGQVATSGHAAQNAANTSAR